jgi:gliding motility-associated-like protein
MNLHHAITLFKKSICILLFILCTSHFLFGQKLSISNLSSTVEDCPSNGSISVGISGGTAPYCYEINPCSSNCKNCVPQKNYTFNSLPSGTYTISVSDNSNPVQTVSQTVTVVGTYLPPTFLSVDNDCNLSVQYLFGKKPFKYRIKEVNGNFGAYQKDSVFVVNKSGNYSIEVTDACGSVRTTTSFYAIKVLALKISTCSLLNGIVNATLDGTGGTEPYKFKMVAASDSTKWSSSKNLNFPKPCGPFDFVMEDACGRRTQINGEQCLKLKLKVICGDCEKGDFTLNNTDGTAPISYYFVDKTGKLTPNPNGINNPIMSNIGSDACGTVSFAIKDACGLTGQASYTCLGAAIIFKSNNEVLAKTNNTYKSQNPHPPYIITCETCVPKQTFTTSDTSVLFKNILGSQQFSVSDACGAKVLIKPGNSLDYTSLVDCPNFVVKSIVLKGQNNCYIVGIESQYIVYDSKGTAIDSNWTGVFLNYKAGTYTVKIITPAWNKVDFRTIVLKNAPFWMWAEIATVKNNKGICKPMWQLHAFSAEKTIFLSGGPTNLNNLPFAPSLAMNRGDTTTQRQNYLLQLEPGTYSLRADCNTDTTFNLPNITTDQLQYFPPLCPNDQNFKLGNLHNVPYWTAFYKNIGMKIPVSNADKDFITLNCLYPSNCAPNFSGMFSQTPGKTYTAYLYTGDYQGACPIDTLTFKLEPKNYKLLDSLSLRYFYCNGDKNNGTLYAQPNGGAPPYTFQILDKSNGSVIKEVKGGVKDLKFSNLSAGLYNFKIKDTCGNEYPIQKTIQQDFKLNAFAKGNCDGKTITLSATKVPGATYNWKDLNTGQSIKSGLDQWDINSISTSLSAKYQLVIQYQDCKIYDTTLNVTLLPALNVVATLLAPKDCLAQIQSISSGGVNPYSQIWSSGEKTANISNKTIGIYTITVTDSRNCSTTSTINTPQYNANPIKALPNDTSICSAGNIQLGVNTPNNWKNLSWTPNTNLTSNAIPNPMANVKQTITYKIVAIDNQGCTSSDTVRIEILGTGGIRVPLAFTPDGNGVNDVFEPYILSGRFTRMIIYNRWGNKVYDDNKPWNGTFNGEPAQADTYIYRIFYENGTCENKILQGDVSLLR